MSDAEIMELLKKGVPEHGINPVEEKFVKLVLMKIKKSIKK